MSNNEPQLDPIAKTYKATIDFTYEFTADELPDGVIDRRAAYDYIRETMTQHILGMGFDSYNDLYDGIEIFESVEKVAQN